MKSLGILWIVYGLVRLAAGLGLILFAPIATVMFGSLLGRVADPFTLMGVFHVIYILAILASFAVGLLGILGGLSFRSGRSGSRGLLVVASLLAACDLPVGIALSVYTLVQLLPPSGSGTARQV